LISVIQPVPPLSHPPVIGMGKTLIQTNSLISEHGG
jgi:hypothetical protein